MLPSAHQISDYALERKVKGKCKNM